MSEWVGGWVSEWVGEWVSEEWMSERVSEWVSVWASEWVCEWVCERASELVRGWASEWGMSECVCVCEWVPVIRPIKWLCYQTKQYCDELTWDSSISCLILLTSSCMNCSGSSGCCTTMRRSKPCMQNRQSKLSREFASKISDQCKYK